MSNITTMASLYTEVTRLLDGEDPTVSDLSFATLARLVTVAQRRIYRDVRCRWNEKPFSEVYVTNGLAAIPDDLENVSVIHFGRYTLLPVDEAVLRDYRSSNGAEKYFAHAGNNFMFFPAPADGTALGGRYWARLPDLDDDTIETNPLFQIADDLFIYAALVESAQFFGERDEMPIWEAKYQSIVDRLNRRDHRAAYAAGRLMVRPSARICGRGARTHQDSAYLGSGGDEVGDFLALESGALFGLENGALLGLD